MQNLESDMVEGDMIKCDRSDGDMPEDVLCESDLSGNIFFSIPVLYVHSRSKKNFMFSHYIETRRHLMSSPRLCQKRLTVRR